MFNFLGEAFNQICNWMVEVAENLGFIPLVTLASVAVVAYLASGVRASRKGR
jgi:hypothetical protein